jgi:hypothetical protein
MKLSSSRGRILRGVALEPGERQRQPQLFISTDEELSSSVGQTEALFVSPAPVAPTALKDMATEDGRKLQDVAKALERSRALTSRIVEVLEAFDDRIGRVEADIMPIHKVTTRLRTMYNNTGASVVAMDHVLSYFHLERTLEAELQKGPEADLTSFLEALEKIDEAIAFFEAHLSYQSSEATVKKFRQLRALGHEACEKRYAELLERNSAVKEPASLPSPLPKVLELLRAEDKESILLLAAVMEGSPTLQKEFVECRAKFLLGTLRKMPCVVSKLAGRVVGGAAVSKITVSGSGSFSAATADGGLSPTDAPGDEEAERRSFSEFTLVFLRLIEHERAFALELFGDEAPTVYPAVLDQSFELFYRTVETTIKNAIAKPEIERVFSLLDLYDDFATKLKGLNKACAVSLSGFTFGERLNKIVELFRECVKQALNAFLGYVQRDKVKIRADGNVHELSSKVLNYLSKRLLPKRTCLEFLVDKWLDLQGQVTAEIIILTLISELRKNLEDKAKQLEKKNPALAYVFLLNNYHYILHGVTQNGLLPEDLLPSFTATLSNLIVVEIAKVTLNFNLTHVCVARFSIDISSLNFGYLSICLSIYLSIDRSIYLSIQLPHLHDAVLALFLTD